MEEKVEGEKRKKTEKMQLLWKVLVVLHLLQIQLKEVGSKGEYKICVNGIG